MAGLWIVRPVHAVAVALPRADAVQVAVPDEAIDLVQAYPLLGRLARRVLVIEQAQFDLLGYRGVEREVGAYAVVAGAQRIADARPCWFPCHVSPVTRRPGSSHLRAARLTAVSGRVLGARCRRWQTGDLCHMFGFRPVLRLPHDLNGGGREASHLAELLAAAAEPARRVSRPTPGRALASRMRGDRALPACRVGRSSR